MYWGLVVIGGTNPSLAEAIIPESGPLFYESGLSCGCSHIWLFVALLQKNLSLQNADPLVVSESEEGLRGSLLGPV